MAGAKAEKFIFSSNWTPSGTVLKLSAGPLAPLNVVYLVTDDELNVEHLFLSVPVMCHLGVDTKTLLKELRKLSDGSDSPLVRTSDQTWKNVRASGHMIVRLNRVLNNAVTTPQDEEQTQQHV